MILKVAIARPIFDNYNKHHPPVSKDRLKKKKAVSFASVLDSTIKSTSSGR